jgi:hypothetical protein
VVILGVTVFLIPIFVVLLVLAFAVYYLAQDTEADPRM